jgi:hypothetical protein
MATGTMQLPAPPLHKTAQIFRKMQKKDEKIQKIEFLYLFIFFHHIRYNFVCKQAYLFPKDKNAKLFPGISRIPGAADT